MSRKIQTVVFLSLILDLFAFTIPLPLFPRLIEWYTQRELSTNSSFLAQTLHVVSSLRALVYDPKGNTEKWDIVLLGGLMGSIFSTLQFIIAPRLGSLSDTYGRKRVLLWTMVGNILSALVWIQSTTFASFLLARAIGGLSEGNVQLAIAIFSDISTPATRSRTLSLVGIAFAICFCIGPPIGAYFSTRPFVPSTSFTRGVELNLYATPAIITLILLLVETVFLAVALPETRGTATKSEDHTQASETEKKISATPVSTRLTILRSLRRLHFLFLAVFSGMEFTLTFLTFDLMDWNNAQNGRLLAWIGIVSALLQGGYVRRTKLPEAKTTSRGIFSCVLALALLSSLPFLDVKTAGKVIYLASTFLGFTSATVVNSLTSWASLQCDEPTHTELGKLIAGHPQLAKGRALGEFRSAGQLGRAIGPILACTLYWTVGPSTTYALCSVALALLWRTVATVPKVKTS